MMRCRACLHADETDRPLREELDHLSAVQLTHDNDSALCVDAMNLEDILGQINANGINVHVGALLK